MREKHSNITEILKQENLVEDEIDKFLNRYDKYGEKACFLTAIKVEVLAKFFEDNDEITKRFIE